MAKNKKDTPIPPSLQPRKSMKKPIPNAVTSTPKTTAPPPPPKIAATKNQSNDNKKRFTLWVNEDIHRAFKIHVATVGGSHSEYIEQLIKKDLKLD